MKTLHGSLTLYGEGFGIPKPALKSQAADVGMAAERHCTNCHFIHYMIKVVLNSCGLNETLSKDGYWNQEESPIVRYLLKKKIWTEH